MTSITKNIFRFLYWKKEKKNSSYPHYDKIKEILVISDMDTCNENFIKKTNSFFQNEKKNVYFWILTSKERQVSLDKQKYFFNENDFNIFNDLKKSVKKVISHNKFDILLDLRSNNNDKFDFLTLFANASFKIGQNKGLYPFKMRIELSQNWDAYTLLCQMIHYLKSIKSND